MADQPTANLDTETSEGIIELMKKMNRELDTTFIFSTHDPDIVKIADHVIRLRDGEIVEDYKSSDDNHKATASVAQVDPTQR